MRRWRKFLALVCIAIVALAPFVPADGAGDVLAFLMPVWLEFQPDVVGIVAQIDSTPALERPVSLRSLAAFRGPPSLLSA
jgi:hypothetical protein